MRITRLGLTDFKAHRALEIEPAPGLTIIRGPNEAGKSTIQQAIELVLFRKADANRDDIRKAWAWGSSSPPSVIVEFEVDGQKGRLSKRFGGPRAAAELTLDGRSTSDHTLIADQVAELTGIPSEPFFRATASVGHAELDQVSGDEPAIGDRLQKAISGADRGTATAKKKLASAIWRYRTEGRKNPGLLKVVHEAITGLEAELAEGEAALARLESDRARWVEAHERREELEASLKIGEDDLAEARRVAALAEQRDEAQDRHERLERAAVLVAEAERLEAEVPTSMPLPQLRTAVSRADNLQWRASELEAEISIDVEAGGEEPEITPPRPTRWLGLAIILVILGGLASFFLSDAGLLGVAAIAGLGIGVVVCLVQAFRGASRRRQYGLAMQLAEAARTQMAEAERAQRDQFRRTRRELEAIMVQLGTDDVESAKALLAAAEEHTDALARIEGELRGLGVERRSLRGLEAERDDAADTAARADHALSAMGPLAEDPAAAVRETEGQVARTRTTRDAARSDEDQARGRVDANSVDAELIAGLAERLAAERERESHMQRRVSIYEGTLAAIEAAEQATLKTAARYLEERMGPTIAAITDGRYDEIEVDERSLGFKVRVPETGELVDVEQLSQGTADQLFLAARLGLVRLVTMDRRPPLILDDAFVTFDAARAERALRLVKHFATEGGFQVLYLTCTDRFDDLADGLVVLPAPESERLAVQPGEPPPETIPAAPETAPRPAAASGPATSPDPLASLRKAVEDASSAERDTGISDPFRLGDKGHGTAD